MYEKMLTPGALHLATASIIGWVPCTVRDEKGEFLVLAPADAESYDKAVARSGVRRLHNKAATYIQVVPDWCRHAEEEEWQELLDYLQSEKGTRISVTEDEGEDMCQVKVISGTPEKGRSTVSPIGQVRDKKYLILETLIHHHGFDAVAYGFTFSGF